jgi:hypothetical protein
LEFSSHPEKSHFEILVPGSFTTFWKRYHSIGLLLLILYRHWPFTLAAVFIAAMVSFAALVIFNYIPCFYNNFLPILDTIIAEQEKNIAAESETKKCKRTQFSIPTLTIIIYVFASSAKYHCPQQTTIQQNC